MRSPRSLARTESREIANASDVDVGGGRAADAVQQRARPQPVDERARPMFVERRQRELPVLQQLDQDPARRHQHERAERGVAHDAERDLDARRRHRGDHHPGAEPRGEVLVRGAERVGVGEPERHPAHVRLVLHARARPS